MRFLREHWVYLAVPLAVLLALILAALVFGGGGSGSPGTYEL
ncbi:MAG: hypothetical protein NTY35_17025 [Planctomycetota bacterium]|nr:hypothetical protein [Planctomycetota bacterium]